MATAATAAASPVPAAHFAAPPPIAAAEPAERPPLEAQVLSLRDGEVDLLTGAFVARRPCGPETLPPRHHIDLPWAPASLTAPGQASELLAVIAHQLAPPRARLLAAFLGRALLPLGARDDWGASPCLVGPGPGKSLVLEAVKMFYRPEDVQTLALNGRERPGRFDLGDLAGARLLLCHEMPEALDGGCFSRLAKGGRMELERYGAPAVSVDWRAPLLLAGNEMRGGAPGWAARFDFDVPLEAARRDPALLSRIRAQAPLVLRELMAAYESVLGEVGPQPGAWRPLLGPAA